MDITSAPVVAEGQVSEATITHHLVVKGVNITLDSTDIIRIDGVVLIAQPKPLALVRWLIRNEGECKRAIRLPKKQLKNLDPTAFYVPGGHTVYTFASLARKSLRIALRNTAARNEQIIESRNGRGYYISPDRYIIPHLSNVSRDYALPGFTVRFLANDDILFNNTSITIPPSEAQILEIMLESGGRICTWTHIAARLYGDNKKKWPERKIIDVFTCRLRKRLFRVLGINLVENVWGRGHRLAIPDIVQKSILPLLDPANQTRVVAPNGKRITVKDLPDPALGLRWVASRKVIVVKLIQAGVLSIEQTLNYYKDMSHEEIEYWLHRFDRFGLSGLKTIE